MIGMNIKRNLLLLALCLFLGTGCAYAGNPPFFPADLALGEGGELIMAQKGVKRVDVFAPDGRSVLRSFPTDGTPTGLLAAGGKAYVTTFDTVGRLHRISLETGRTEASVVTGSGACAPLSGPGGDRIYVCNQFQNTVSEIDPATMQVVRTVRVLREPRSAVFSKDGKYLFVANFLPDRRADADYVAASVSVIEMKGFTKIRDIRLANGSNAVRGICITPDGKYVYASHNLGRYAVPTSQLYQGWMNTSAFSVIDVERLACLGTVVADEPERGAAGIWGIVCNGEKLYVSHSGTHDISVIDHKAMLRKLLDCPDKEALGYDLNFLYGLRRRIPLQGNGPRTMALYGGRLYVPTYFADVLNILDVETNELTAVALNPGREETDAQKGERLFNDASRCFQNWQSCNGCHPGGARSDGMNWDLMNDGVGNPKNCKSLLYSHPTPPSMISGIRETAEWAVRAGFRFIQFFDVSEEDAACVDAYLKSLQAVPSPYLVNGELSEKARQGKKVFEKLKCGDCHSGIYYTDRKMHRIGQDVEFEKGWDTPTLREVWRTAPYLFDGRAATMHEVFSIHRHGIDRKVSRKEIEALTEFVNSL